MGSKKITGIVLFGIGAVILILAIGIGDSPGFGWKQTLGVLLGAVLTVVGLALGFKK
jgi:peptidoglycan/LPS O-acetylase OafA/YrhL